MMKKGLIATVIAFALLLVASPAQADVIGGGGTANAGGALAAGGNAPANWDRVVAIWDPSSSGAYDDFLSAATGNGRYAPLGTPAAVEKNLSELGILEQCKSARLIVYLRDENYGVWMRYTSGFGLTDEVTSGDWTTTPGNGHVFVTERNTAGQKSWTDNWTTTSGQSISPKQEVMNYASAAARNTNVICAWNANQPTKTQSFTKNRAVVTDADTWTEPYAWMTSVKREISANKNGKSVDPIAKDNLKDQPTKVQYSDYANVYDDYGTAKEKVDTKRDRVEAALKKDAKAGHAQLELTSNNQAGLAEGGVLSVYEQTQYATIKSSESTTWERCTEVSKERRWNGSAWVDVAIANGPTNANCDGAPLTGGTPTYVATNPKASGFPSTGAGWRSLGTKYSNSKTLGTAKNTGFWQILSVHCNPTELSALLGKLTGESIVSQTAGVDGKSTTVLNTKKYNDRNAAIAAKQVVGAKVSGQQAAINRTAELGFYDKECDLTCVANPGTASGASSANDATNNASINSSQSGKGYYGGNVLNQDVNSNYLEIFRDNDDTRVDKVNVFYPSNADPQFKYGKTYPNAAGTGSVNVPAAAAKSTTVTRWNQGTPDGTKGGDFSILATKVDDDGAAIPSSSVKLFTGTGTKPGTQLNFATNPYNTKNSTTLNGFYNNFIVKSTWASETNRPQVLNVKWEYSPTVWTRIPSKVGFGGGSANNLAIPTYAVKDQPLDGRCYAQFGTDNKKLDLADRVSKSTGTGTTNSLDSGLLETANGDNSWKSQTNLVLKFVRAVSE